MVTPLVRTLAIASKRVAWLEMLACKSLIVLFTGLLIVNVGLRYVMNSPLFFAEELAVYILIWMAFLAISLSLHENTQVRLTLLTDNLPRQLQYTVRVVTETLVVVMLGMMLFHSMRWIQSPSVDYELAITLGISKTPFFVIIPLFCATSLFHTLARLLTMFTEPEEVSW